MSYFFRDTKKNEYNRKHNMEFRCIYLTTASLHYFSFLLYFAFIYVVAALKKIKAK